MNQFIAGTIRYRRVVFFAVLSILLLGVYSFYRIPKQEFPDVSAPIALIDTLYPGASPQEIEQQVTNPIEGLLLSIPGYNASQSYSSHSRSIVITWLDIDADVDKAWKKLRYDLAALQSALPEGCRDITVNTDMTKAAGFIYSLSGLRYDNASLAEHAESLKAALLQVDGVVRAEVLGRNHREIRVKVDPERLLGLPISLQDISDRISVQTTEMPTGSLKTAAYTVVLRINALYDSVEDLRRMPLGLHLDTPLTLGDVAEITLTTRADSLRYRQNHHEAVLVAGTFKENEDIVKIGRALRGRMEQFQETLPEDLFLDEVLFMPDAVRTRVRSFVFSLVIGMLLVIGVILVGMGLKNALVISAAIPLSILLTLSGMGLLGIDIHQISIAGLIISLGMLVDNSIVVTDAIQARVDEGQYKLNACVEGTRDVALPVLTSTLTTIAAFLPLLFLPGVAGQYVYSLPLIVIMALAASYLTALLFVPAAAYPLFQRRPSEHPPGWRTSLLSSLLRRRSIIFTAAGLLLLISLLALSELNLQFFPKADKSLLYIDIRNTGETNTEALVTQAMALLDGEPEVLQVTGAIHGGLPKFYATVPLTLNTPTNGQILVQTNLSASSRFRNLEALAEHLQEKLGDRLAGQLRVQMLELADPIGHPIRVHITGRDIEELHMWAEDIQRMLQEIPGTLRVQSDYQYEIPKFVMDIHPEAVMQTGITRLDIQREVAAALSGRKRSAHAAGNPRGLYLGGIQIKKTALTCKCSF